MYIAAYLRENDINVDILDTKQMQFERPSLLRRSIEEIQMVVKLYVKKNSPSIVGITSTTISYTSAAKIAKAVKEASPETKVVIGGIHVTFLPQETLEECPWIDIVVKGEGEIPMLELANNAPLSEIQGISWRKNGKIIHNETGEPLPGEKIPIPAYDMLDMTKYSYVVLMISRGCTFRCSWCEVPYIQSKTFRDREKEKIKAELDLALSLNPNLEIRFEDEFAGVRKNETIEILEYIRSKNLSAGQFRAVTRPTRLDKELILKFKEAGCTNFYIGMESGSDDILRLNKRGFSTKHILETAKMMEECGMLFHSGFILGLPGETTETLYQTLNIALQCCDATFSVIEKDFEKYIEMMPYKLLVENSRAEFNILAPNPGTLIYKNPEKYKFSINTKNWEDYDCNSCVGLPKGITAKEIEEFKYTALKAVQDKMKDYGFPVNWWDPGYKG